MFRVKSKGLFNGFVFRTFEFGICPSTSLRVVSLSNHLAFRYYYFGFQGPYRIVHFIRKT